MNTQDSNEDVLFRQDRRYTERGAGGFSSSGQADGGDRRSSLPVQPLKVPRYPLASELSQEPGQSLTRRSPEEGRRFLGEASAGLERETS
jgi:hypothetical protein